mmetsp:Transcript_35612/g.100808  ORF Transcript_35612/g.100808 Transcript_35612/m.100808 type:complete len:147 (+) Transcript_35612:840-1280(+)
MSWAGLAIRGAGQVIFGVMAGMEMKDVIRNFYSMPVAGTGAGTSSVSSGSGSSEMVVAVVSKDPNVWVCLGRLIGITLAIFEGGKLLASALVAYEQKASRDHFYRCREDAYARIEQKNSGKHAPETHKEGSDGGSATLGTGGDGDR